tara:strand:- start:1432 stop:2025 length:594 start_codon:yes stop_codon:yes gene_type:complete
VSKLGKDKNKMRLKDYQNTIKEMLRGDSLYQSNFKKLRGLMVQDSKYLADKKYNLSVKHTDWNDATKKLVKSWKVSPNHYDTISRAYRSSTKLGANGKLNKKGMALSLKSIQNLGLIEESKKSGWEAKKPEDRKSSGEKQPDYDSILSDVVEKLSILADAKYRPDQHRLKYLQDRFDIYMLAIENIEAFTTVISGKN